MSEASGPDQAEQASAEHIDDIVPTHGYRKVPVVGLGGSAGSIEALQSFFTAIPPQTGLAFVVVIHLAPDHDSALAELLQRCTRMPVVQVQQTLSVEPGKVYVIPPARMLQAVDGQLRLGELPGDRARHVAVDIFFRTLADTHGPHAAAIVLSGLDGDGAIGIKRIKERGGLTVAQDPGEALHASMPRSAIATGMVDWILPVQEMAPRLLSYFRMERSIQLPLVEAQAAAQQRLRDLDEAQLREVLAFLRTRTGRDFNDYKRGTVLRRIARRMQVNGVDNLPAYLTCLRTRPGECAALLQDLLISVTNFFRDPDCFDALAGQLPALFEGKGPADVVRVWVIACATGEEAYSIAILLAEHARRLDAPPMVQVFATDLDKDAIAVAREGMYPVAIEADVSAERLRCYFQKEHRGYRVRREIRETVLFAVHDVLRDSPFSRLDLASCRNLMIYLNRDAQARLLEVVNFALAPGGLLFLGSSESIDDAHPLLEMVDKKHRIVRQRRRSRRAVPPAGASNVLSLTLPPVPLREPPVVAAGAITQPLALPAARPREAAPMPGGSWGDMHLRLLEQLGPPSVLVNEDYEIVHLSPSAGRFLQLAGGEPSRSLLRSVHPDLRLELRAALYQSSQTGEPVELAGMPLDMDGGQLPTTVRVAHFQENGRTLFLVTFSARSDDGGAARTARLAADPLARHLDREIERLKSQLRETVEQYEASTEELKASNEELQAMNEELRAATEELETSREELQSINEELSTVNHELKAKVDELSHANSDMHNLMDATAIATVFLDRELRITRYTPAAVGLFNLIPSDLGRPLTDMATQLDYPQLGDDARRVLERLVPVEREVGQSGGSWYLARLMPYRTMEDRIAGVVFTFIDISERKQAEEMRMWLSAVVTSTSDAIISFALDQTILSWNSGAQRIFGYSADDAIGQPLSLLAGDAAEHGRMLEEVRAGRGIDNLETVRQRKDGSTIHVALTVSPIRDGHGQVLAGTALARDVSAARAAAEALRQSEERLRMLVESAVEYAIFTTDLQRRISSWNTGAQRLLGYSEAEAVGQSADMIFTDEERAAGEPEKEAGTALREGRAGDERRHRRKDGSLFPGSGVMMVMRNSAGEAVGFVKILRDATARPPQP